MLLIAALCAERTRADISTDGTLGARVSLEPAAGTVLIPAGLGKQAGTNLFHSFDTLAIGASETAVFQPPTSAVERVFVRVTGSAGTRIDGVADFSSLPASVWILSRGGISVGPSGRIIAGGDINLSTADQLHFADGHVFPATATPPATLSTQAPSAFGFLGNGPASIRFSGDAANRPDVAPPTGSGIALVAGNIQLSGYRLLTTDGTISLIAVAGIATVPVSGDIASVKTTGLGDIELSGNAVVDARGLTPGSNASLGVLANTLTLSGPAFADPALVTVAIGAANAPPIRVNANRVTMTGSGRIGSITGADDPALRAGEISVRAGSISIQGLDSVQTREDGTQAESAGIYSDTLPGTRGAGGDIVVKAHDLQISQLGTISATSFSDGPAGNVRVRTSTLTIDGSDITEFTGIGANAQGLGAGGSVRVTADDIQITRGGGVATNTFGPAAGGDVRVEAGTLSIVGPGDESNGTGLFASSIATTLDGGEAGSIAVVADVLSVSGRGKITVRSEGGGAGGTVLIDAGEVLLSVGDITAAAVAGVGGDVTVMADEFRADQTATLRASAPKSSGGNVSIATNGNLVLSNAAVAAEARNDGGNVRLSGQSVLILRSDIAAGSQSDTATTVRGGNIEVAADQIGISESQLIASAVTGAGGSIALTAEPIISGQANLFDVSSQFGTSGTFVTSSPVVDLAQVVSPLSMESPGRVLQIEASCLDLLKAGRSSFSVQPRGGVASHETNRVFSLQRE